MKIKTFKGWTNPSFLRRNKISHVVAYPLKKQWDDCNIKPIKVKVTIEVIQPTTK